MNFNDYLMKRLASINNIDTAGKTEKTTDGKSSNSSSVFNSISAEDLAKIDFEKLLSSGIGDDKNALNNALKSFLELEDVQKAADADGDGELSAEEAQKYVQSVIGKDGDASTFSMADIDAVMKEMGIDLDAVADSIEEVLNEDKKEDVKETEKEETPKKTQETSAPQSAGGAGGAGSVGGGGGVGSASPVNSKSSNNPVSEAKGETPEEIKKEIDDKNNEIDEIETQAEQDIQEQEEAKEKMMQEKGVSEKELEEYKKKEEELENQIKGKDEEIKAQDDIISDSQSSIDSNKNYISDIDSQISANESAMSSISADDENASSKKSEIQSKIDNLNKEKQAKEDENKELESKIKEAENKKTELEAEKQKLEEEKQKLLTETLNNSENFCKGMPSSEKQKVVDSIKEFDTKIQEIRNEKNTKVAEVKSQITELETKLKDAEAKEERDATLNENSVTVCGSIPEELASQIDAKCGAGFSAKVEEIAKKLNCDPEDLLGMMYSESGLNSKAVNGGSGATGLIQFMPSTAQGLGTSTSALAAMSPIDQLDYVEKFYESNLRAVGMNDGRHIEAGTLYALAFLPAYANREVLTTQGENYYNSNSGLDYDRNGDISTTDLTNRVRDKYKELYNAWT